jgi:hypothetical protein
MVLSCIVFSDTDRREQMEVAEILGSSFPGWVQSPGKRRFGSYGPQRAFVKVSGS